MSESSVAVSPDLVQRQWDDLVAAKLASRREFIARQLARTPDERLAVMVAIGRRVAALRS